jgi:hypothetical protein
MALVSGPPDPIREPCAHSVGGRKKLPVGSPLAFVTSPLAFVPFTKSGGPTAGSFAGCDLAGRIRSEHWHGSDRCGGAAICQWVSCRHSEQPTR